MATEHVKLLDKLLPGLVIVYPIICPYVEILVGSVPTTDTADDPLFNVNAGTGAPSRL